MPCWCQPGAARIFTIDQPMQIKLTGTGKRYNREWIFRHFDYEFLSGKTYAITGPNGSGKSTLLQVIAGSLSHNEGTVEMNNGGQAIAEEARHQHLSIAAPYLELVEEMTAREFLSFHRVFKPLSLPDEEILSIIELSKAADKQIRYYSSGMKQRLKLAQALFCQTPVLLLDEPTTNLDASGAALYRRLIGEHLNNKLVIISSNDKQEYAFCGEVIPITDYKP
jgi:ABC-type multidrug transport system ATPase subunit